MAGVPTKLNQQFLAGVGLCLTVLATAPAPAHAGNPSATCTAAALSQFSVKVGDVELNPTSHYIRFKGVALELTPYMYTLFEELLFSEKPISGAEFEDVRRLTSPQATYFPELGRTGHNSIIKKLRLELKKAFGHTFSARVRTLYGIGYYWERPADPSEIQPGKIWKSDDRTQFYFGDKFVELPPREYALLMAFKEVGCRPLTFEFANQFTESLGFKDPLMLRPEMFRYAVSKLNRAIRQNVRVNYTVAKSAEYRTNTFQLVPGATAFCK